MHGRAGIIPHQRTLREKLIDPRPQGFNPGIHGRRLGAEGVDGRSILPVVPDPLLMPADATARLGHEFVQQRVVHTLLAACVIRTAKALNESSCELRSFRSLHDVRRNHPIAVAGGFRYRLLKGSDLAECHRLFAAAQAGLYQARGLQQFRRMRMIGVDHAKG